MITPSTTDILAIIGATLDTAIKPDLQSAEAKSAAATMAHLLRHVGLRLRHEGQILTDDIAALRPLLADVAAWLADMAPDAAAHGMIGTALTHAYRAPGRYPDLESLAAEAGALRKALTEALVTLIAMRESHGEAGDYRDLRDRIRRYLADQIRAEAMTVNAAFEGRGPRR